MNKKKPLFFRTEAILKNQPTNGNQPLEYTKEACVLQPTASTTKLDNHKYSYWVIKMQGFSVLNLIINAMRDLHVIKRACI